MNENKDVTQQVCFNTYIKKIERVKGDSILDTRDVTKIGTLISLAPDLVPEDLEEVRVLTLIRTVYSNEVLVSKKHFNPFLEPSSMPPQSLIHRGNDLLMFNSSLIIKGVFRPETFDQKMMYNLARGSSFTLRGIYTPSDTDQFPPIICNHILLKDDHMDSFKESLAPNFEFVDISYFLESNTLYERAKVPKCLLDDIKIVEGKPNNEWI